MADITWLNNTGSWSDATQWNPGTVPGSADTAIFSTSTTYTVTYDTTDSIAALSGGDTNATLAFNGGSLGLLATGGNSVWEGTIDQSGGTLAVDAGVFTSEIGPLSVTGGTDQVAAGATYVVGDLTSLAGTLAGVGEFYVNGGSATVAGSAALLVGTLDLNVGTLVLGDSNSYAGTLIQGGSESLDLNGNTLTLGGRSYLTGFIVGSGALDVTGTADLYTAVIKTGAVLNDSGFVTEDNEITLGGSSGDSATIDIAAGGVYNLLNDTNINVNGTGLIVNAGTFEKTGVAGVSDVFADLDSTGTLAIDAGTLDLVGGSNTLSGLVDGAGQLYINNTATVTLEPTATLDVGTLQMQGGGDLVLAGTTATSDTYAGTFLASYPSGSTINTSGHTLTLTGTGSVDVYLIGGGTLDLAGSFDDSGIYLAGGSTELLVTGVVTQSDYIQLGTTATDNTTLDIAAGGTYAILTDLQNIGTVGAATIDNAGLLEKLDANQYTLIYPGVTNTGTMDIASGTLALEGGANALGGLIEGAGQLYIGSSATATLAPTTTFDVASLQIQGGGDFVLGGTTASSDTYAGTVFANSNATINTNGSTLTLTGSGSIDSYLIGGGTLDLAGSFEDSGVYLAGSHTELLVTGSVTQSGYIQLGTTSTDSTTLDIAAGGTYAILNDFENIGTVGAATIDNAGLLEKLGATQYTLIYPGVTSTGTIDIASGTLALEGGSNALGGLIEGAGQLYIGSSATVTLAATATLDVGSVQIQGGGDLVLLGSSDTYGGPVYANANATINTDGHALSLTGTGSVDSFLIGGGTLDLAGSFEDGGIYLSGNHTELLVTGSVTQSSYIQLGTTATDSTTLDIASGATYDLLFDGTAIGTVGGATILNAGLIEKTAAYGDSYIEAPVVNTGTVDAITGTIEFAAAVTNDGLLEAGGGLGAGPSEIRIDGSLSGTGAIAVASGGTADFAGSVTAGQTVALSGSDDLVYLGAPGSFLGTIDGFTTGDTIDLAGIQGTAFTYNGTILTVGSASIDVPGLTMTSIALYSDGTGGTDVEYNPSTPAFSFLSTVESTDTWTGSAGDNLWSDGANWSLTTAPGPSDMASISSAGTITYDLTSTINALDISSSQLDIFGGTLQVDDGGNANSSVVLQSAGTLDMVNGYPANGFAYTLTASAVGEVDNGTWFIDGGSLGGTLFGSGAIELLGTTTLGAGLAPDVGTLILDGSETLESDLSYAGVFENIGGTLDLNGFTLTLSGSDGQLNGTFTGGEIIETGSAQATILPLDGTTTLDDAGLLTQSGQAYLYGGGLLTIAAGGTYDILGDNNAINTSGAIGTIENSGLFEKTAATGSTSINATLDNAAGATLDVASGIVTLADGGTFAGNLIGAGELAFSGGGTLDDATPTVATLALANGGGLLALGTSVTYAGTLDFGYSVGADLAGNNLTLTGTDDYVQNGFTNSSATVSTVDVAAGATVYDGDVFVYPSVELDDFGTVLQDRANNNGITLQDSLVVENGATYDIISDANISDNSTLGTISNLGLFEKTTTTGSSNVQAVFDNAGTATLDVATGTIVLADGGTFAGNIIGAGELEFAGGGTLDDATPTVGTLVQADGGGTLTLGTSVTYAGSLYLGISENVDLAGNNLTLTGTNDYLRNGFLNSGASVSTVDIAAGATAYDGDLFVNPSIELDVFGSVLQEAENNNGITLQGSMVIETGGTYDLISDANINVNGTIGTISNAGLFEKTDADGTSNIYSVFDNAGTATLDAARGTIALQAGGTLGGTLAGNAIDLAGSGTYTLDAGTDLTGLATLGIGSTSATLELLGNTTFAGALLDSGVIDLNGNTLTLTATADSLSGYVEGPGEIIIAGGATAFESSLEVYGTATQDVAGLVVQDVQGTLGSGAGDNSLLTIAIGGTYDIINDYGIQGFGSVDNAGTFEKTGVTGLSTIATSFNNEAAGVVLVSNGTLSFTGPFGNQTNGTLTGGIYEASGGGGIAGTLDFTGSLTDDAADIVLSGPGSEIYVGGTSIEQQLTMIDVAGSLELENGHSYVTANTITDSGLISLAGGLFQAASLDITSTGTLSGYGTVTDPTNDGTIAASVSGETMLITTPITGTGDLVADAGATLELGSSVAATQTLVVAPGGTVRIDDPAGFTGGTILNLAPGATLDFGGATVTSDTISGGSLDIVAAGTSLSYALTTPNPLDRPAVIANATSGDNVVIYAIAQASSVLPNPVAYGEQHVGTTIDQPLTIANTDTSYPGFTENLDASFSAASGGVSGTGTVTGLAAGSSSTALGLSLDTASDGTVTGAATLALSTDGTGVDGNGPLAIGTETITGTGTLFNYATASPVAPNPVVLGELHTGTPVTQVFTIANTATADGFSENLDGAFTGASAGITTGGTVSELAAGSSSTGLNATIDLTSDGVFSGAATLGLISDGSTIDTLGTTALPSETIAVGGTAYNYATASVSPSPIAFGEAHVGDTVTQALTITNTAPADAFSEELDATIASSGSITSSGSVSELAAGGVSTALTATLDTANAGSLSGFATLGLISDGFTVDTLGTTALPAQTIAASGDVFRLATASVAGSIDFGIVHVGDTVSDAITIANTDSADGFSENLDATAGSAATGFTLAGTADEIGAGSSSDALTATLDTATAGTFSGDGTIGLISDGSTIDTLGTTALPDATISLAGTVLNFATAAFDEISGTGSLSGSATSGYTLDLGTLAMGGAVDTADLGVLNTAIGPADTLAGSFAEAGSGFSLTGFGPFTDVTAGGSTDAGTVDFNPVALGTYFETLTLDPTGFDPSFSADLAPVVMLVEADVTCFAAGTRIATPAGETAVERLRIGDAVVTASGAVRPIRWVGQRSYAGRIVAGNRRVLPVLIRAGALADNVPRRDLYVSPNHAMHIDGALIPAIELVNGVSIVQVGRVDRIAYFHIELDTHDVLLAEGAPAESFVDDDSRMLFHNAAEYRRLYPDAAPAAARYCAPRLEDGEELEAVRRRLAARAAAQAESAPLWRIAVWA